MYGGFQRAVGFKIQHVFDVQQPQVCFLVVSDIQQWFDVRMLSMIESTVGFNVYSIPLLFTPLLPL